MLIFSAIPYMLHTAIMPETYSPYLLRQRAVKLSKETGLVYTSIIKLKRDE